MIDPSYGLCCLSVFVVIHIYIYIYTYIYIYMCLCSGREGCYAALVLANPRGGEIPLAEIL